MQLNIDSSIIKSTQKECAKFGVPSNIQAENSAGEKSGILKQGGEEIIMKEIPGSDYLEFAKTKYLIIPNDENIKIQLSGYELGRYTLTIATLANESQVIRTQLRDATTTPEMTATFILENGEYSTIVTDLNGDGLPESETTLNGKVISVPEVNFHDLRTMITSLRLKRTLEKLLLVQVTLTEKLSAQSSKNKIFARATERAFDGLESHLRLYTSRGLISEDYFSKLLTLMNILENNKNS